MASAEPSFVQRVRSSSLSIGQLTFGSFLLVLLVILLTSIANVLTVRHIGVAFTDLQRLQTVGAAAENIDRRVNDLRLAARDYVARSDPQPDEVSDAVSSLSEILSATRIDLAPEEREMIDGVVARLATYRDGIARVTMLMRRRNDEVGRLSSLRTSFEVVTAAIPDRAVARALFQAQNRVVSALLVRDAAAAEQAARQMRQIEMPDETTRKIIDDYANAVIAISETEGEISTLDKDVLGTEGKHIGRVTELLRDLVVRRGRMLSGELGQTLSAARWQSIALGTVGVLIGLCAALFVVRRTVRSLSAIAMSMRALAEGKPDTPLPEVAFDNEIGDIARAAEVFRRAVVDAEAAREAAVRALAEQRLAEESYRKLFEGSVDGIYVTTPGGALLNANPALAGMMGYETPAQLIAATLDISADIYVEPAGRTEYVRRMERDGMVREFEYQVRQHQGGVLWLSDSATAVRDGSGRVVRYEGTVRDITNQKRAEMAVTEGRRLLQQVIDTVPAVINVKDTRFRYLLMNRYMAGIFGVDPSEALGRTTKEIMARYQSEKSDDSDKRVLATGRGLGFYEEEYKDFSGAMRQWLVNKIPLLTPDGEVENIVTVALDIGERKRSEQEILKAKDAAEAALRNLRETQNSLIESEKLAALGRLVAGVAHEVNNPVGISLTVASSLERKIAIFKQTLARGDLRRSSLVEFIESNADAAAQLVANLNRAAELIQSFKQVAADRNYSDQRVFDLAELTEQVVMSLKPGLRNQNLELEVTCQPGLVMNSYPGPYGQVLTNLFLNAIAHAFPGGAGGTVEIRISEAGPDQVEILFSDNGVGMSPDVRRRAFDPFFTTQRDQGGTGLGLHIVYSIVTNRLGGRLTLDTEPGRGTRIRIVLPRVGPLELAAE